MRTKQTKRKQRVFIQMGSMRIPVKAVHATQRVSIDGTVLDALKGERGTTIGCAISNMAMRAWPHKVYFVQVTARTLAVVTEIDKNGQPKKAVIYQHNYRHITDANDKGTLKKMVEEQPRLMEKSFTFYPPLSMAHKTRGTGTPRGTPKTNSGNSKVLRGSALRAFKAGFISRPVMAIVEPKAPPAPASSE